MVGVLQFACSSPVNSTICRHLAWDRRVPSPSHCTPLRLPSRTFCRVSISEGNVAIEVVECISKGREMIH